MARSRNIKPGFFTNEDLVELDFATRLLFAGLWTVADRAGRLQDRPKKIKIDVFPADNLDIDAMLTALHNAKFITRYEVDGAKYIQIHNWTRHQNPHHTEKASEIPDANGVVTVKAPLEPRETQKHDGECLADSLLLIPDSLIPDSVEEKAPRKRIAHADQKPDDVDRQTWDDWIALRAKKKTTVSKTVIDEARRESQKADLTLERFLQIWCLRGSQGLQADWIKPHERQDTPNKQEALEARNRAVGERWASGGMLAGAI